MIRVGLVTQWFDPEVGSAVVPGFIARALTRRGFAVDVLTGYPNYPTGRIYPGYQQHLHSIEKIDRTTVHRVPLYPDHSSRAMGRAASYASFALTSALGMGLLRHCDVLLVYSTPVTVGLGAVLPPKFSRQPVLTFVQDLWPETMFHSGIISGRGSDSLTARVMQRAVQPFYTRSDLLALSSPGMVTALASRGIPRQRMSLVYNWVDESLFAAPRNGKPLKRELGLDGRFVATYAGNLGQPQNAGILADTAWHLRDREDIVILVAGEGVLSEPLQRRAQDLNLRNVVFMGRQPISRMPDLMDASDAQIVTLAPNPLFDITMPSKIQFSLGFGQPIAASVSGDPARVLTASQAALVTAPGDSQALAKSIRQFASMPASTLQDMAQAGRAYYDDTFSESIGGEKLAGLVTQLHARALKGRRTNASQAGA